MKKVIMTWVFVFLTMMLCGPGQAAIEFDPGLVSAQFTILEQGGSFFYYPATTWINRSFTVPNQHTLTEFVAYPGSATLYSQSSGGTIPWGSQVQVYADITYTDGVTPNYFGANTYGMNVYQHVSSNIVRKFTNTNSTPMTVNLMAEFTGDVNFDSFNYDYATGTITNEDTYAYYLLSGLVTITEYAPSGGATQGGGTVVLDNDTWSDSELVDILPASEGYWYELSTALVLETFVKNWTIQSGSFPNFPLSGDFFIGSDPDNPFTLTATVPVPPSLVLLISGLGGLALTRRRFSKGR